MSAYVFGLFTIPAVALIGYGGLLLVRVVIEMWPEWRPEFVGPDKRRRANVAAALVVCRRYFEVVLPCGFIIVFRSKIGRRSPAYAPATKVGNAVWRALLELDRVATPAPDAVPSGEATDGTTPTKEA